MSELVVILVSSRQAEGGSVDSLGLRRTLSGEPELDGGGVTSQDLQSFPIQLCMSVIGQSMRGKTKHALSLKDKKRNVSPSTQLWFNPKITLTPSSLS